MKGRKEGGRAAIYTSSTKTVPAVLHVSHEAQKIALRHYLFYFSLRLNINPFSINFDADTSMFGDWRECNSSTPVYKRVKVPGQLTSWSGKQRSNSWLLEDSSYLPASRITSGFCGASTICGGLALMERRPGVHNHGGFWTSRRWDLCLHELDRAFKHFTGEREGCKVRYITEDKCWAIRAEE